MNIQRLIDQVKAHPRFNEAGMILAHNGVVRATSRDGRAVTGLQVAVDNDRLAHILQQYRQREGIVDILVEIAADRDLSIGDDVMALVVAGDIRETVIDTLRDALNDIKSTVTTKTEYFA